MMRLWKRRFRLRDQRGFTLIELLVVVAIIGILAAIGVPLYSNVQARARLAKAATDSRALASAVAVYAAHCGDLPGTTAAVAPSTCTTATVGTATVAAELGILVGQVTNAQNQTAGPFMNSLPGSPQFWNPYSYVVTAAGTFEICSTSVTDAAGMSSDGGTTCP
jgi:prepilin-type N-terminal cleavage/methylation domain-containing protein